MPQIKTLNPYLFGSIIVLFAGTVLVYKFFYGIQIGKYSFGIPDVEELVWFFIGITFFIVSIVFIKSIFSRRKIKKHPKFIWEFSEKLNISNKDELLSGRMYIAISALIYIVPVIWNIYQTIKNHDIFSLENKFILMRTIGAVIVTMIFRVIGSYNKAFNNNDIFLRKRIYRFWRINLLL